MMTLEQNNSGAISPKIDCLICAAPLAYHATTRSHSFMMNKIIQI